MTITSPALKALIYDIISHMDGCDENKKPAKWPSYEWGLLRGVNEIKKSIADALEVAFIPQNDDPKETLTTAALWLPLKGATPPEGHKPVSERHTQAPIELSNQALEALKFYADKRNELPPNTPTDALDELERLLVF